ncbi:hypothetical protein IEO21_09832 [Rhodonia placenta]|uniref:Integrase catalytic domain-containing protein n=1 Tax=Rhodonia placenta TaxID=104341 RepID=A0A8H7TY16_9APHY|nr:hypothetical protein IEO21_09832 [Postia placenta]
MGFTNSPAEFQKCMVFILQHEIPMYANIFIDDLPIKGAISDYPDHDGNPEVMSANPGIRRFIFIVGQKCTPEGRLPEPNKIEKIINWPPLKTIRDVRAFMGLCGTVRIWIHNYSKMARPLTELTRHDTEFIWDERRNDAFNALKIAVTSAPALRPIDYESMNPVVLSVDSSKYAAGFILSQYDDEKRKRPARYGSIPMSERESRYSQPKLELYGLYRALRAYRLYLIGVKNLQVEVDAKYIKGMLNEPDLQPNATINRWIQGVLLFHFTLIHVPAERHKGPDALSRRELGEDEEIEEDDDSWLDNIALYTEVQERHHNLLYKEVSSYWVGLLEQGAHVMISTSSKQDKALHQYMHFLRTLETPVFTSSQEKRRFIRKASRFLVRGDKMYRRNGQLPPLRVMLDAPARLRILVQAHEGLGHRGEYAVMQTIKERFYWPHMWNDVHQHVKSCHECQIRSTRKVEVPITISAPATIFSKIYLDIMEMPKAKGFKYIIAARDDLSRASEGRALHKKTAKLVAAFFFEQILCRYGAVGEVVTDNGGEFKKAFQELMRRYHLPQIRISSYNSKANGVVERGHFILRESIIKACQGKWEKWPNQVHHAFFTDRITVSHATGYSPYYLLYGVHPVLPFDLLETSFMIENFRAGMSTSDLLALRIRQLQKKPEDITRAAEVLKKSRLQSKQVFERRYAKRLQKEVYNPGDLVLVRNSPIEKSADRKHQPRYLGPYQILRRTKGGSYALAELDGAVWRQGVAAFRLLPYVSRKDIENINLEEDVEGEESEDDEKDVKSSSEMMGEDTAEKDSEED